MEVSWWYRPLDVYAPYHASGKRERFIAGGFGSGKTYALCADAIAGGLQVPGSRILMTRRTVPEVRDTLEPVFLDVLPPELYAASKTARAGGHLSDLWLPNGTHFLFRSIDDWQKHKSLNLARIYWDELSEFDQATYQAMLGRLRQQEPTAEAKAVGYGADIPAWFRGSSAASNPAGHDWMWGRFIDKPNHDRVGVWVATSLDNPTLPEDYLEALLAMPEAWVKRYVLASFDEFGGLIYPEWSFQTHTVDAFEVPRVTPIWMALDPGTRHPTAALWVAQFGRTLVGVHEEMEADWGVDAWVKRFRRVEAKLPKVTWRVADPNSVHVRDRGTMMSLHAQYRRHGFIFHDGPGQHKDRIPMLGTLIKQGRFKLMRGKCPRTFDQIANYRWEDLTPAMKVRLGSENEAYGPEKPVKVNDDLVDAAQYLSSRWSRVRPPTPKRRERLSRQQALSQDVHAAIRRQRQGVDSVHDLVVPV